MTAKPPSLAHVIEQAERDLGPALFLSEILRCAASEWKGKPDDELGWIDKLPGDFTLWHPSDYEHLPDAEALALDLMQRFAFALHGIIEAANREGAR